MVLYTPNITSGLEPIPEEETPLIPGGGDNDNDDDEWRNVDLSHQPVPEEDREQWHFPPDTTNPSGGEAIEMATRLPPPRNKGQVGALQRPLSVKTRL